MGIKYFYHFCLCDRDPVDLDSDILSAVRKAYFAGLVKIRDKITYDSEGTSLLYDYCIEKDKPLRWTVKSSDGTVMQDVQTADDGRYFLCYYRDKTLYKRLLFSRLHTLLKAEYMDENGAVAASLEPRRLHGGLCLLYTDVKMAEPLILTSAPEISDDDVAERMNVSFTDYTAVASTNDGTVRFLSDEQQKAFALMRSEIEAELSAVEEESFVGEETPLYDRINAKDFNVKRNLSAALDISMARDFGTESTDTDEQTEIAIAEEQGTEEQAVPVAEDNSAAPEGGADVPAAEIVPEPETNAPEPDKLIMADGAVYSYYGDLDENGNRSGYGRTLTDLGRTAYEGSYYNDKRSGVGAYFYKDGTLCYSGDWLENVRHGVGVGVSARDGSIHAGRWSNNKPEGNGVRLSRDGEIKFVCKELADGSTVLMNYLTDDTVLISKYDSEGKKMSEKSVSLTDF